MRGVGWEQGVVEWGVGVEGTGLRMMGRGDVRVDGGRERMSAWNGGMRAGMEGGSGEGGRIL